MLITMLGLGQKINGEINASGQQVFVVETELQYVDGRSKLINVWGQKCQSTHPPHDRNFRLFLCSIWLNVFLFLSFSPFRSLKEGPSRSLPLLSTDRPSVFRPSPPPPLLPSPMLHY